MPEPGQKIQLPLPKKKQAGFEMVGLSCQCSVLLHSDFDSQSAGPEFESPADMDDLVRRFRRTHNPEIRKEIEELRAFGGPRRSCRTAFSWVPVAT
jgi:hypothetical protein